PGATAEDTALYGTIFDPLADSRPILTNFTTAASTRPAAVVTIDNSFSVACDSTTEVSGFIIDGNNPNMPTMLNNGIVTGNILDPALGTGVTGFDINSNFIVDTTHGVHITHLGDGTGALHLNRVEGEGFRSNSGLNVYQFNGALALSVEDNLVYNIFGEDLNNDGMLDIVATGTEDVNGNGKLDVGEDLDNDGLIDINEDNDKDGVLGDDDIGIGINLVADSDGAVIFSNDPANRLHIVRNVTHLAETEYFRQQSLDADGNVVNAFTAQDINNDIRLTQTGVISASDTFDNVGNKNGINVEARDGGAFSAFLDSNDTSFNNPYAFSTNVGDNNLLPPNKNPLLTTPPTPLGNEFGLRTAATGVNSVLILGSPNNHLSNNNFGHGYLIEAINNASVTMDSPMTGSFTTDPITGEVTGTTPSEFNDNGLNGMRIYADQNSSLALQIGIPDTLFDPVVSNPDDKTTRSYFTLNQFVRNGADGDATTAGNGIEIVLRSGAGFAAGSNSGIFAAALTDNADNGLLIDVADPGTNIDDFTVLNSVLSGNLANGMYVSAENTPISNLVVAQNSLNNNGLNGINFQMLNSNLNDPMIVDNLIMGNGNLVAVNPISQFNIEVVFLGGLTASQQAIFQSAADRWAEIIVGDLPDVGAIDDVQITAEGLAIDGVNGILGQAGPTALRNGSNLPFQGLMEFDSADLAALEASGQLEDVILHEMGHVLGIGTIWNLQGLLQNPSFGDGVTDTRFTGALATTQYNTIFGVTDTGVPVENSGGPGTADGHWRESILDNELMTGFLNSPGPNPLSRITAGSLQDLGYIVNLNKADFYADPTPLQGGGTSSLDLGRFNNNLGPFQFMNATPTVSNLVQIDPNAMGNGINISVQNSNLNNVIIESNIIDGNTGDGVRLINPQFATNNEGDNQIHWRLNEINNNGAAGGYGINVALNNANHLDAIICQNDISGNNLGGINVELSDNAVYHNGLVPPASLLTPAADEESWFFGNTINGNGGIGYHITAIENSSFTLVGGPSGANTLNNNVDAGIAIEMSNGAQGDVRLDNTTITGTTDGTDPNFAGDGIGIIMGDNTVLNNLRIGDPIVVNPANPGTIRPTNISNNANHGVTIEVSDNASLAAPLIANATISNNGTDGIHVNRTGTAIVGDPLNVLPAGNAPPATSPDAPSPAFVIRDNTITGNGDNGIDVAARLAPINDEYVTMNNNISNNGSNGIELLTQGDAGLLFDVRDSTVNNNGLNGLAHTSILNSGTDTAAFTGTIVGNEFSGNAVDGILIFGNYGFLNNAAGTGTVTRPVQIGSNFTEDLNGNGILDAGEDLDGDGRLDSDANIITDNGVHGIDLSGAGFANITNALIDGNGDSGIFVTNSSVVDITDSTISNNGRHGIELTNDSVATAIDADINRNIIRDNARDGVQIVSNYSGTTFNNFTFDGFESVIVRMDTNMVLNNGGRGIDTTAQGDGSVSLSITDITVAGNGENGIYNLVTASTTQDVEALASVDLAQDGVITANAYLNFSLNATAGYDNNLDGVADGVNLIANNNANDTYEGGGVVFRVGTTGSLFAPGGGNFSWLDPNSVDPRDLGGLVASLQNTSIVGNNGVDFWTHTFTSTVDPGTTGGTWTDQNENPRNNANDAFNPTNYQQDPLARIEFTTFTNVSGGSADVFGISRNFSTASNQDFAFYNNSEDVFKSRTQGQDNNTDGGIDDDGAFTSGTRPRNGTRTPSRFGYTTYIGGTNIKVAGTKLDPQLQIIQQGRDSDQFLYPGLGDSTMRISAGSDLTLSLFNFVVSDFTDEVGFSQGTNFSGGNFRDVNFLYEAF
ncbi:MAG: right-handed parallel beta-helix repeat-containing protein, partial [Planctomycetaceae bacterium]|nr:right-handed parallel beta-helix repeat-containing protein [Planctomycetaceae bacterium]